MIFILLYDKLVDNPTCCDMKTTKMFCENVKVLLFDDEEYK
jgi:hypothetical protein